MITLYKINGNKNILGELYKKYMHLVFGLVLKYLKDKEKSKDFVIEIYEKIQTEIIKFDVKNFKNWLFVVARNHCLMELRKSTSLKEKQNLFFNETFMEYEPELHPIDKETFQQDQILNDCIERLEDSQKNSILLFYFENKSYRQIAIMLECDEKNVKSFIQNARRNLKICIEKKGGKR